MSELSIARYRAYVHPCGTATIGAVPPQKKDKELGYEIAASVAQLEAAIIKRQHLADMLRKVLKLENEIAGIEDEGQHHKCYNCIISIYKEIAKDYPNFDIEAFKDSIALQWYGDADLIDACVSAYYLGLSSLRNSRIYQVSINDTAETSGGEKPKRNYGGNGITSFGRLRVKDGAAVMQSEYGRRSLAFATITLPTMKQQHLDLICENWGEFANRIVEEIKRELKRKNAPLEIVYCVEIQEHRYKRFGIVAPHLHLLWYAYACDSEGKSTGEYAISANWLRELVGRVIDRITGVDDIALGASCDIQKVKKNAAAYLGKYMSKGGKIVKAIKEDGKGDLLPRQWWGITKELRNKVQRKIKKIDGNRAMNMICHADKLKAVKLVRSVHYVYAPVKDADSINRKFKIDSETGEYIYKSYIADMDEQVKTQTQTSQQRCYGAVLQLSPKAQSIMPVMLAFLDICEYCTDEDLNYLCDWISAINNTEMLEDVLSILDCWKTQMNDFN